MQVHERWFERLTLCVIALSCVELAIENPRLGPNTAEFNALYWGYLVFGVLFVLVCLSAGSCCTSVMSLCDSAAGSALGLWSCITECLRYACVPIQLIGH
jgi:hypothetical protein